MCAKTKPILHPYLMERQRRTFISLDKGVIYHGVIVSASIIFDGEIEW